MKKSVKASIFVFLGGIIGFLLTMFLPPAFNVLTNVFAIAIATGCIVDAIKK